MKKYLKLKRIVCIILVGISINIFSGCTSIQQNINKSYLSGVDNSGKDKEEMRILNYDEVKDSLIRFHVIANSDSDEDQQLKLKVRDKVIDYLYPYLNDSESLEESRQIIKDRMDDVKKLAQEVIKDNKYDYSVRVELSRENFPDKSYGNITLPQGNYEAFRIIIGSGQGKNWWCVMFPPLCFVDESKAQVEYDQTENKIKSKENKVDLQKGSNTDENESSIQKDVDKQDDIQIKFKIAEIFKDIFN
jgi:stage II sporulation protein R